MGCSGHGASRLAALALALALALGGCVSGRRAPAPLPAASATPAAVVAPPRTDDEDDVGNACREQVAGLEDWLRAVEAAGLPLAVSLLDDGANLAQSTGAAVDEPAPLVHMTANHTYLEGEALEAPDGLERGLGKLINLRHEMMPRSPFIAAPRCYLAVDATVPWSAVVSAAGQAAAGGVRRLTFLFADPSRTVPAPPPSSIDPDLKRLRTASQSRRQQIIAELMALVYQNCPEALGVIARMGASEVADFKQVIVDELPEAIGACACAPDEASIKALHWAIFGNPTPVAGATVRLTDPKQPAAAILQAPGDEPWARSAARVIAAAADEANQPVAFAAIEVEPPRSGKRGHPRGATAAPRRQPAGR